MIAALPEARVDATDRGIVEVLYLGRLGNRLTQYCMGRIVATALGFDLWSETIPGFPNVQGFATDASPQSSRFQVIGGHRFDLAGILADRTPRRIVMRGFFHRYEYYRPHKELIREWLASDSGEQSPPDELTIHVRAGDIWKGDRDPRKVHPEYHGLPFSFYDGIVRSRPWSKVKVVTEDRSDPMVGKLVATYDAELQSGSKLEDFNALRASSNLVLSVSSYAWWAGWLSNASQIFFPVVGFFDQARARQRPSVWQQDVWVDDEPRYVAIRPAGLAGAWTGTEEERQRLLNS